MIVFGQQALDPTLSSGNVMGKRSVDERGRRPADKDSAVRHLSAHHLWHEGTRADADERLNVDARTAVPHICGDRKPAFR